MTFKFTAILSTNVTVEFEAGSAAEGAALYEDCRTAFAGANVENQQDVSNANVDKPRRGRRPKEQQPAPVVPAPLAPPVAAPGAAPGNVPSPATAPGVADGIPPVLQRDANGVAPYMVNAAQNAQAPSAPAPSLPGLPNATPAQTLAQRVLAEVDRRAPNPAVSGPWLAATAASAGLVHAGQPPEVVRSAIAMMTDDQVRPLATVLEIQ